MDQLVNLVIVAIAAVCVWLALRPHYAFLIAIDQDGARVAKGKVAREFVSDVSEVCGGQHIASGWIGGIARGRRMKLAFSRSIPAPCQQRLRNLWAMHR